MTKSNCKDCTKRTIGCHATCESYQKFRAELTELNNLISTKKTYDRFKVKRIKRQSKGAK